MTDALSCANNGDLFRRVVRGLGVALALLPLIAVVVRNRPRSEVTREPNVATPDRSEPTEIEIAPSVATQSAAESQTPPPKSGVRIIDEWPTDAHAPHDAVPYITFDRDVDTAAIESSLSITPSFAFSARWPSPRRLELVPAAALPSGQRFRIRVDIDGSGSTHTLSFRARVRPARHVVPGNGAPVVLTFDDGAQTRQQGEQLLDLLNELEVRAILFPTGQWVGWFPDLEERARREGHLVCNHTYSHRDLTKLTDADLDREITRGAGHGTCDLLRPPYGATDRRVEARMTALGYRQYLWDIDTRDWEEVEPSDIVNVVMSEVKPGAVVLLHFHGEVTLYALPRLVRELRDAGYKLDYAERDANRSEVTIQMPRRRNWSQAITIDEHP